MVKAYEETLHLNDIHLFKDLDSREISKVKKMLREFRFAKGEMLLCEGDHCERIIILCTGRVKVFRLSASGREQILDVLVRGDSCACHPGASTWQCSANAQALCAGKMYYLSRADYVRLVESNNKLAKKLAGLFAQRMCRLCSLVEDVSLSSPQQRLAKFILDMARPLKSVASKDVEMTVSFTHDEISQRLGLVRETVTRHLNRFKKARLIEIRPQRIIIKDQKELRNILS
jgi:CRP-like cAMP-binding protein